MQSLPIEIWGLVPLSVQTLPRPQKLKIVASHRDPR